MPKVEDIFSKLNEATYFTTLDLCTGYHHIPLDKSSIPKTAFNSPFNKYEYVKYHLDLCKHQPIFQETYDWYTQGFPFCHSLSGWHHHIQQDTTGTPFTHSNGFANLSMKKSKCSFFLKEIQYLGHILSATGIWPLPSKTHAIQNMNPPTTPKQVRAFLRLVGYYRKFIRGFAKIAKPLILLTRQQVQFDWTPEHQEAFIHLKEAIVQAPILHYPNPNQDIYYIHQCFWWCLQSTALSRTQWNWVPSSILIPYLYWNTVQMEYHRTGSLWSILCHHKMEIITCKELI